MSQATCEFCKRVLVVLHDVGTFDISGKTSVLFNISIPLLIETGKHPPLTPDLSTARCDYIICSIRRWWKSLDRS